MTQHLERLDGLAPMLRQPALELIQRCQRKLGRTLMVVSGWRSVNEQMLNYQKGRVFVRETGEWEIADKALVVTHSKPGLSAHNVITRAGTPASMALNVIPLLPNGQPDWNVSLDFFDDLYEISWKVGLDPLSDTIGAFLKDELGYFEEPGWKLKIDGLGMLLPAGPLAAAVLT
jgi:hypothetical protein